MAKLTQQKARKEYTCQKCGKLIEKGQEYYKITARYQPVRIRCLDCRPKPSELASGHLADILAIEEEINEWANKHPKPSKEALEELAKILESSSGSLEDTGSELQEKADNIHEYFSESDLADQLEERSQACEEAKDQMGELADEIKEFLKEGKITVTQKEREQRAKYKEEKMQRIRREGGIPQLVLDIFSFIGSKTTLDDHAQWYDKYLREKRTVYAASISTDWKQVTEQFGTYWQCECDDDRQLSVGVTNDNKFLFRWGDGGEFITLTTGRELATQLVEEIKKNWALKKEEVRPATPAEPAKAIEINEEAEFWNDVKNKIEDMLSSLSEAEG